jgi:hypothetical protein
VDGTVEAGELNYIISKIVHNWLEDHGVGYSNINTAIGVLECAKLELYRQIAAPYERQKRKENGPVSALDVNDE